MKTPSEYSEVTIIESPIAFATSVKDLIADMNIFLISALSIADQVIKRACLYTAINEVEEEKIDHLLSQAYASVHEKLAAYSRVQAFHKQDTKMRNQLDQHTEIVKQLFELFTDEGIVGSIPLDRVISATVMAWVIITGAEEYEIAVDIDKRTSLNGRLVKAVIADIARFNLLVGNDQEKDFMLQLKFDQIYSRLVHEYVEKISALSGNRVVIEGDAPLSLTGLLEISKEELPFLRNLEQDLTDRGLLFARQSISHQEFTSKASTTLNPLDEM
ncbi:hypothetical protein FRC03_002496 [Tulasnella sp. 419]|nr:hypothetical protein FRC03_002496 [Tulasnella sp. 419]